MNIVTNISKWIKTKFKVEHKEEDSSIEYKVLIVGEHEVGKTSLCNRFIMNEFNLEIKPTKESECYSKLIQFFEEKLKIYIVDVDTEIMSSNHSYIYTDVKGAIVLSNPSTYRYANISFALGLIFLSSQILWFDISSCFNLLIHILPSFPTDQYIGQLNNSIARK